MKTREIYTQECMSKKSKDVNSRSWVHRKFHHIWLIQFFFFTNLGHWEKQTSRQLSTPPFLKMTVYMITTSRITLPFFLNVDSQISQQLY